MTRCQFGEGEGGEEANGNKVKHKKLLALICSVSFQSEEELFNLQLGVGRFLHPSLSPVTAVHIKHKMQTLAAS